MPNSKLRLFVAAWSLLILSVDSQAKDWRGIVPLRSTRADVFRLFGKCSNVTPSCEFTFKNENVHIEFSGNATSNLHTCSKKLRPDTVLLIEVTPQKALEFKELQVDRKPLRAFPLSPPMSVGYRGYIDDKEGLVIKTYEEKVIQLDYIAGASKRSLCRDYYANPESFVQDIFSSHAPAIALDCPTENRQAGEKIRFNANFTGKTKITLLWNVSAGRIIAGQGTRNITVDTSGLQGQVLRARVILGGVAASCDVKISP
jgi:hypothetical protein